MKAEKYRFLEHTADIKFKAWGKTPERAFENAALALSEIFSRGEKVSSVSMKRINLEDNDIEGLLYSFIDELIYLLDAEGFLVSKAKIRIEGNKLKSDVYGDDALRYPGLEHVKAATYSEMHVKKIKDRWEVQVVVDM